MNKILNLLVLIYLLVSTNCVKRFTNNTNYDNSKNWKERQVPCSGNHLVFPARIPRVLFTGMATPLQGIHIDLPINGEIVLDDSLIISAFDNHMDDCDSTVSHFTKVSPDNWYNPLNWCQADNISWKCLHKPQVEASIVPSATDFVVFPPHNTFYVGINNSEPRILAKSIFFRGKIYTRSYQFQQKIRKTFTRKNVEFFDINSSYPPQIELQGNKCKKDFCVVNSNLPRMDLICKYVTCRQPECHRRVKPKGSCCEICGHLITVGILNSSNKTQIGDLLNKFLDSQFQSEIIFDLLAVEPGEFQLTISPLITDVIQFDKIIRKIVDNIKSSQTSNGVVQAECTSCDKVKPIPHPFILPRNSKYWISLLCIGVFIIFLLILILYMNRKATFKCQINLHLPKLPTFRFPRFNFGRFRSNFPRVRLNEVLDDNFRGNSEFVESIEMPDAGNEISFDNPIYVAEIDDSNQ